jgi:hypothetical protein
MIAQGWLAGGCFNLLTQAVLRNICMKLALRSLRTEPPGVLNFSTFVDLLNNAVGTV